MCFSYCIKVMLIRYTCVFPMPTDKLFCLRFTSAIYPHTSIWRSLIPPLKRLFGVGRSKLRSRCLNGEATSWVPLRPLS